MEGYDLLIIFSVEYKINNKRNEKIDNNFVDDMYKVKVELEFCGKTVSSLLAKIN